MGFGFMYTVLKYQNQAVISCPPASGEIGDDCHSNRTRQGSYSISTWPSRDHPSQAVITRSRTPYWTVCVCPARCLRQKCRMFQRKEHCCTVCQLPIKGHKLPWGKRCAMATTTTTTINSYHIQCSNTYNG